MHDMDAAFRALADPARRRILDRLNEHSGLTVTELCSGMGMTRQAVSKHLDVLAEAELVTGVRRGREKRHDLNAAPINDIAEHWIHRYDRARAEAQSDLKTALAATSMNQTTFFYATYILATPEQVWRGLTEPAFTTRYWGGVSFSSTWGTGATYDVAFDDAGLVISDPEQIVLESDPYRRLAYTWHTFTPEWAVHHGFDEQTATRWRAERRSTAVFDIEDAGAGVVRLTILHDGFEPGSSILERISSGWPAVFASLKSLLETGLPLPTNP